MTISPWWRDAVIYQIYPRSWADSDGDGIGDLPGITARLPYLVTLGVDAVWLSPFYTSPQHDGGYDVADYRDVDPLFGTLDDFDALTARAHQLGLRVIVDLVPNHSSDEHIWFREALASPPGSRARARYLFRDGVGESGQAPPNNWESRFGGPAWTRVTEADGTPGQWYLHMFDTSQPDFDWTNPEVRDEIDDVLRFWLDRGVDGFRVDVAHGLVKADGLPDTDLALNAFDATSLAPMWDQPGVHEIYRRWRTIVDEYAIPGQDADRILCAEAWVVPGEALTQYVRADEMHQSFNFPYLTTPWLAAEQRAEISASLEHAATVGAPQTWVLSNHDVVRHASRLGYRQDDGSAPADGVGPDDPQPDAALGLRRARAATAVMLALPGSAYLFQGEELGLPEATRLPADVRHDPTFARTGGESVGRDGCRVPMPWEGDAPACGFGPSGRSWLPQPAEYRELAVDRQDDDPDSTLNFYRGLLRIRRERRLGSGTLTWLDGFPAETLAFTVTSTHGSVTVLANLGAESIALPDGARTLISSQPVTNGALGCDETIWLTA